MRKIVKLICILLVSVVFVAFSACTVTSNRKLNQAEELAVDMFSLDKILFSSSGPPVRFLLQRQEAKFVYYIVGERDNNEIFIVSHSYVNSPIHEAEWPYILTFREIVEKLEYQLGIVYDWDGDGKKLKVYYGFDYDYGAKTNYDFTFFMYYDHVDSKITTKYIVCQRADECLILTERDFYDTAYVF